MSGSNWRRVSRAELCHDQAAAQPRKGERMTTTSNRVPGVIDRDAAYSLAEFRRRTGLGSYAFRQARTAGLRVVEVGRKRYVLGSDWLRFLEQQAAEESSA